MSHIKMKILIEWMWFFCLQPANDAMYWIWFDAFANWSLFIWPEVYIFTAPGRSSILIFNALCQTARQLVLIILCHWKIIIPYNSSLYREEDVRFFRGILPIKATYEKLAKSSLSSWLSKGKFKHGWCFFFLTISVDAFFFWQIVLMLFCSWKVLMS